MSDKERCLEDFPLTFAELTDLYAVQRINHDWLNWKKQHDAVPHLKPTDMFNIGEHIATLIPEGKIIYFVGVGTSIPTHEVMIYKGLSHSGTRGRIVCVEEDPQCKFELPDSYKSSDLEFAFVNGYSISHPDIDIASLFSHDTFNVIWDFRGPFNLLVGIAEPFLKKDSLKETRFYENKLKPLLDKYQINLINSKGVLILDNYDSEYEQIVGSVSSGSLIKGFTHELGFAGWRFVEQGEGLAKILIAYPPFIEETL